MNVRDITSVDDLLRRLHDLRSNKRALVGLSALALLALVAIGFGVRAMFSGTSQTDSAAIVSNQEVVERLRPTDPPPVPDTVERGSGRRANKRQ